MMLASRILFGLAFACYLVATVVYVARLVRRSRVRGISGGEATSPLPPETPPARAPGDRLATWGSRMMAAGVLLHSAAIISRWVASGVAPVSNMYEYMSLTGWSVMIFYALLDYRHRLPSLGAFVAPVGVVVIAYASVFPSQVQPLVPALQSYWLVLHVALAAFGEGAFAVGFAAALLYLLRTRAKNRWEEWGLEVTIGMGMVLVAFISLALGFKLGGYQAMVADPVRGPVAYGLPPLVAPSGTLPGEAGTWLGIPLPLGDAPAWLAGVNAARKLNTLIWSLGGGLVLYGLGRLLFRQPIWRRTARLAEGMNSRVLDEVSYNAIAAGFPLFTLGGLAFGMVWAQKAWGSYWSWDPKETWALISWLFYAGYLHLRISRGWIGRPAAWAAVLGFLVIMFTLVGVNLLIVGLHSYAG